MFSRQLLASMSSSEAKWKKNVIITSESVLLVENAMYALPYVSMAAISAILKLSPVLVSVRTRPLLLQAFLA